MARDAVDEEADQLDIVLVLDRRGHFKISEALHILFFLHALGHTVGETVERVVHAGHVVHLRVLVVALLVGDHATLEEHIRKTVVEAGLGGEEVEVGADGERRLAGVGVACDDTHGSHGLLGGNHLIDTLEVGRRGVDGLRTVAHGIGRGIAREGELVVGAGGKLVVLVDGNADEGVGILLRHVVESLDATDAIRTPGTRALLEDNTLHGESIHHADGGVGHVVALVGVGLAIDADETDLYAMLAQGGVAGMGDAEVFLHVLAKGLLDFLGHLLATVDAIGHLEAASDGGAHVADGEVDVERLASLSKDVVGAEEPVVLRQVVAADFGLDGECESVVLDSIVLPTVAEVGPTGVLVIHRGGSQGVVVGLKLIADIEALAVDGPGLGKLDLVESAQLVALGAGGDILAIEVLGDKDLDGLGLGGQSDADVGELLALVHLRDLGRDIDGSLALVDRSKLVVDNTVAIAPVAGDGLQLLGDGKEE